MYKLEASSAQNTENGLYSEVGGILCQAEEGGDGILRILTE